MVGGNYFQNLIRLCIIESIEKNLIVRYFENIDTIKECDGYSYSGIDAITSVPRRGPVI